MKSLLKLPDGRVLVGGSFDYVNGSAQPCLCLLKADGTLDTSFSSPVQFPLPYPQTSGTVYELKLDTNGGVLVAGGWIRLTSGVSNLFRLRQDLSPDTEFVTHFDTVVVCVASNPSGEIIAGGGFHDYGPVAIGSVAKLKRVGSILPDLSIGRGITASEGRGIRGNIRRQTLTLTNRGQVNFFFSVSNLSSEGRRLRLGCKTFGQRKQFIYRVMRVRPDRANVTSAIKLSRAWTKLHVRRGVRETYTVNVKANFKSRTSRLISRGIHLQITGSSGGSGNGSDAVKAAIKLRN